MHSLIPSVGKNGEKYYLASGKVKREKTGGHRFAKVNTIELVYIRKPDLHKALESICSFSFLEPEKIMARLGR